MRLCSFDRHARSQTCGEIQRIIFWLRQIVQSFRVGERGTEGRMNAERQPDIGRNERAHSAKSIGGDADYSVRAPIDLEIAADEIVSASVALPIRVTTDHHAHV